MFKPAFWLLIDVEATCSNDDSIPRHEMEIIELGAVMVEASSLDVIETFQSFVRPQRHPRLTPWCRELTTIRQIEVDTAQPFPQVLGSFSRWLRGYHQALFCSWGEYDRIQLQRDCRWHRVAYPLGERHRNLKTAFASRQKLDRPIGLTAALRHTRQPFQGTLHRALDDALNMARLLPWIVR
jgi:inhibitor of KinA sporulation pathway (predicted exonuclease)